MTSLPDSVFTLPVIVVRAARLTRQEELDLVPGTATVIELDDLHSRFASTAEVIERVPGLHVRDYGSLGTYSTVSIRGSTSQQVQVYLDGVPLTRSGLGVVNLAELPFAALERVEVYRGFAPSTLPGAGLGGAINLVTRRPVGARGESTLLLGGGSFDAQRIGFSHRIGAGAWDALVVADRVESRGDFTFYDDNCTWQNNTADDTIATRLNNAVEHSEVLVQISHPLAQSGSLRLANQWVDRRAGVPGIDCDQALQSHAGVTYDILSLECRTPRFAADHLTATVHLSHDWRHDTFVDRAGEIGLGFNEDNHDVSRVWGARTVVEATASDFAVTVLDAFIQRESFEQWRVLPAPTQGPTHRRVHQEAGIEERLRIGARLGVHLGLRWTKVRSEIAADSLSSNWPARSLSTTFREPRAGIRLQVWRRLHARTSAGKFHRTPGFLELFHDGGTIRGNPALLAESGTNRDAGLQWESPFARTSLRLEATHFDNDVDNLISLRRAANTYVAMNIGRAELRGEEYSWSWSDQSPARRWSLEGNYTYLRATDTSINTRVYFGKKLPLQPTHQFFQRFALRARGCEFGYEFDHLGDNFLNQWNTVSVPRRDLHAVDVKIAWRALGLHAGVSNLTDERVTDVAKLPLPGRTFFATSSVRF